jgi:hypothetical protein
LFLDPDEDISKARDYETPTEAEYFDFLSTTQLAPDKESYVRMRAWWCANDRQRASQACSAIFTEQQLANLGRLSDLFDEAEPDERLLKAELARERGMFDEAMSLLDGSFPEDFSVAVRTMRSLCEEKRTAVAETKYE